MRKNGHIAESLDSMGAVPEYMSLDKDNFAATFERVPERNEMPIPIDEQQIVEWYTRLT